MIFGTRPEAIKLAPVIKLMQSHPRLKPIVCVSAQHRQMLDQVLEVFSIIPDVDLDLMQPGQTLATLTSRSISAIDRFLQQTNPDLVMIQGDTTTVLSAALSAFYLHIPVAHVEAGLRTGNMAAPWPEEANRVLTSRLADLHFAPTAESRMNLIREGIPTDRIWVTGNTVIDSLHWAVRRLGSGPLKLDQWIPELAAIPIESDVVLVTGHRRENFGDGLRGICTAMRDLAALYPSTHFVYPMHFNPQVRAAIHEVFLGRQMQAGGNVHLIEPVSYLPFVALMLRSTIILTDSGGVQEEAPGLGKPVLVTRDTTERPEAVLAGTVRLVGSDAARIVAEARRLLDDGGAYREMSQAHNPYGDGHASSRILDVCSTFLCAGEQL